MIHPMLSRFIFLLGLSTLLYSCSTNTIDDVLEPVEVVPELVTFQDVQPIFNNSCTQCHSNPPQNGAPMPLVDFESVRNAVLNRGLIDRISREEGESGLMPLGGPRLPQNSINLVIEWEQDGLLEN
ncbi:MAG: hypothetical protein AAFP76_13435 [Bacteroidota bacterium]